MSLGKVTSCVQLNVLLLPLLKTVTVESRSRNYRPSASLKSVLGSMLFIAALGYYRSKMACLTLKKYNIQSRLINPLFNNLV